MLCNSSLSRAQNHEINAKSQVGAYPIVAGGFLLSPSLKLQQTYNDNALAQHSEAKGDFITTVIPQIQIKKSIRDHDFFIGASSSLYRYARNSRENINNYSANFHGKLTALRGLTIPFKTGYRVTHLERNLEKSLTRPIQPTKRGGFLSELGIEYNPNRLAIKLLSSHETARHANGRSRIGGLIVRKDRDYNQYALEATAGYQIATRWTPFISFRYENSSFLHRQFNGTAFNGPKRDNIYTGFLAGLGYKTQFISADLALGKGNQHYNDPQLADINSLTLRGNLGWEITDRTFLEFSLQHRAREDALLNLGYVETLSSAKIEYELDSDLFWNTNLEYRKQDYRSDRSDIDYSAGIGLYYILSPSLQAETEVRARIRDSNIADADYMQNTFTVGITGNL